jgi:hypothetical protein
MFKHKKLIVAIIALTLVIGVLVAEAGVSFIGSASVGGGSVVASGKAAGCGNENCDRVEMDIVGYGLTAWCQNNGGKIAPGRNTVSVDVSASATFFADANGQFPFNLRQEILPTAEEANCPNGNWDVIDLTGPLSVTLNLFETDVVPPADTQVFSCQAVLGAVTACFRTQ